MFADSEVIGLPATRGDCLPGGSNEERPCPFVSCRHHLGLDESMLHEHPDWDDGRETCSLDIADNGESTLIAVASLLRITHPGARYLEKKALLKMRKRLSKDM